MSYRILILLVLLVLLGGGALLATLGTQGGDVSLTSLIELWSDTLRDADQPGMLLTRISDDEETRLGQQLAATVPYVQPPRDPLSVYVNEVGRTLTPGVARKGIHYAFHVMDSPSVNAFALPGGQIFVNTGLLSFVQSEAELAAVLGHEMAHVDLRHCVESYQYQTALKRAGLPEAGWLIEMAHRMATASFSPGKELDADAAGERLSVQAGYDPEAPVQLFTRMAQANGEQSNDPATTPAGELGQATRETVIAFLRSHPPSQERSVRLQQIVDHNLSQFAGRRFYVGRSNVQQHVARSQRAEEEEWKRLPPPSH